MGKINWRYEIGDVIKDEKRDMTIIDREIRSRLQYYKYHCNIDGNEYWIYVGNLDKGGRCNVCSKKRNWKYEIGQIIKDEKRDMIIIDRELRGIGYQYYKYHCNIDGNEDWISNSNLKKGTRCNVCSNYKAMLGVNTIWDTDRYLVEVYGLDEEFAKTHTIGTTEKGKFTCKDCGNIKLIIPTSVKKNKSIGCSCGDKVSYPEKFVYSMLKQLNIDFKSQLTKSKFKWIGSYKYDFYVPSLDLILETHGGQHGKFITSGELTLVKNVDGFKMSKRDDIKIDSKKCWLAYKNGIDNYIQLDCSKSDLDYIKNNILNSELNKIFNLNNIDWNKCEEFALKNIAKEVCDYWYKHREINKEDVTTGDLAKMFNVQRVTIREYLKNGTKLGWCNYNPKEEINYKKVRCIELNKIFTSISEAGRSLNVNPSHISAVCKGKLKTIGGYHWEYVEETEEN